MRTGHRWDMACAWQDRQFRIRERLGELVLFFNGHQSIRFAVENERGLGDAMQVVTQICLASSEM